MRCYSSYHSRVFRIIAFYYRGDFTGMCCHRNMEAAVQWHQEQIHPADTIILAIRIIYFWNWLIFPYWKIGKMPLKKFQYLSPLKDLYSCVAAGNERWLQNIFHFVCVCCLPSAVGIEILSPDCLQCSPNNISYRGASFHFINIEFYIYYV